MPRKVPPATGSGPNLDLSWDPPHISKSLSSHLHEITFIRFMPLASETSMGAMRPRNNEGTKEETRDILAVARYIAGYERDIFSGINSLAREQLSGNSDRYHPRYLVASESFISSTAS